VLDVARRNAAANHEQYELKRYQGSKSNILYMLSDAAAIRPFVFSDRCRVCHYIKWKIEFNRLSCTWLSGFIGFIFQSSMQSLDAERHIIARGYPQQEHAAFALKRSGCAGRELYVFSTVSIGDRNALRKIDA